MTHVHKMVVLTIWGGAGHKQASRWLLQAPVLLGYAGRDGAADQGQGKPVELPSFWGAERPSPTVHLILIVYSLIASRPLCFVRLSQLAWVSFKDP